jgi:proteasome lid subunit RPN8/RPN11
MQFSPSEVSPASLASGPNVGFNVSHAPAIALWKAHAINCTPNEAVGVLTADGNFHPIENISPEPNRHFTYRAEDYLAIEAQSEIIAMLHSHTDDPPDDKGRSPTVYMDPSKLDMENQIRMGLPWGISIARADSCSDPIWWGDTLPIRPLLGRVFMHGIQDCYTLVRDWHRLQGVVLPEVPRDDFWWTHDGVDLYAEAFEKNGFEVVTNRDLQPGDGFLAAIRSPKLNHAGIYIGKGQILHHLANQLSMRSSAGLWRGKMAMILRHKDLPETLKEIV